MTIEQFQKETNASPILAVRIRDAESTTVLQDVFAYPNSKGILRKYLASCRATRAAPLLAARTRSARFLPTVSPNVLACPATSNPRTPYGAAWKKEIRAIPILVASQLSATLIALPSATVRNLPSAILSKVVTVIFKIIFFELVPLHSSSFRHSGPLQPEKVQLFKL